MRPRSFRSPTFVTLELVGGCVQLGPDAQQEQLLLAVMDGHGPHGRNSAMWLARNLPKLIKKVLENDSALQTSFEEVFERAQKQMKTGGVNTTIR